MSFPLAAKLARHLRQKLIAGVLALIPLAATILLLRLVFDTFDNAVQPLVKELFGHEIIGVGIGITILAVYLMGVIATNVLGRIAFRYFEALLKRMPIVRWVYNLSRQIVDSLSTAGQGHFRVVMVQWPREGIYTLGFLTGSVVGAEDKTYCNVLIPTTPTPQSGLLAIIPEEEVIFTNLSFEEGLKMVISSGVLTPKDLMRQLGAAPRKVKERAPGASEGVDETTLVKPD